MANDLPINLVLSGSLPSGFVGTPQQIAEAIIARTRLQSTQSFSLFATGSTEPSSNVGPWLKDNREWYVWDDEAGGYVPQSLNNSSIEDGSIVVAKLAPGIATNAYPFRASSTGSGQSIMCSVAGFDIVDIAMPTESFDPDGVYNPVTGIFTAPEAGWYTSGFFFQIDNNATNPGQVGSMQIGIFVADASTGANLGGGVTANTPSPTGSRWFLVSYDVIQLAEGQTVRLRGYALDGTGSGQVDVVGGNCYWSMHQLKTII